ncbi:MAG: type IX secretion system outer membrane channel protein PorV [Crocinitomix sp.]|nr:type IX secretion system outer membrane channel protein PorV [Crocinitomix sp.]
MKFSLLFLLSSSVVFNSSAQISSGGTAFTTQLNTITTAVPFVLISPDARSSGMGDVGAATDPDAYSIHWNTSKLAFSEKRTEIGVSYSPWLRNLIKDVHYTHASGYTKLGNRHTVGASMTYFSLGLITFTGFQGNLIREFNPNEYEFVGAYALRLSKRSAIGVNLKYIYSNLTGGINAGSVQTKPGLAMASDISYSYFNKDLSLGTWPAQWSFGVNISNFGNKMAYTVESARDFIPANLKIGSSFIVNINKKHSITAALDVNKLLVPTLPARDWGGNIVSGLDNNVGALVGIVQSFYDAPGNVIISNTGVVTVEKNSRLKEELNEINIGGGFEYQYKGMYVLRTGYFYEHKSKGARQYLATGLGYFNGKFGADFSYLLTMKKNNPLANTMRFSLNFAI